MARFRQQLASGNIEAALAEWTGTPLAGLEAPWPHPGGGRAGGAVAGHGGDRPRAPTPDRPDLDHRPTDRAHREPSVPGRPVVAADDRALPGRTPGRRARRRTGRRAISSSSSSGSNRVHGCASWSPSFSARMSSCAGSERSTDLTSGRPTGTVTFGFCEVEDSLAVVGDAPEEDGCGSVPARCARAGCGGPPRAGTSSPPAVRRSGRPSTEPTTPRPGPESCNWR